MMRKKGFTLIELLVVISIIAVLLSILMPALNKAKNMARMVICSNNLHQIAIGLNSYAAGNDGYYMERPDHWVNSACWDSGGSTGPDLRQILLDHVSMKSEDLLFCPAALSISENMGQKPGYNANAIALLTQEDYELWSKHFFIDSDGSTKFYSLGYNIFAGLLVDEIWMPGGRWIWTWSGNSSTSREPRAQGAAKDCIAADYQWSALSSYGSLERPITSNHSPGYDAGGDPCGLDFISSNAVYGDGHVEKRKTLEYYVERDYSGYGPYIFAY